MTEEVRDEMLMALADGELEPAEAEPLRRLLARNAGLAARYDRFVRSRQAVRDAWPREEVPAKLLQTVLSAPTEPARIIPFPRRVAAPMRIALAASLLIAIAAGAFQAGRITAPGPLDAVAAAVALSRQPTGAGIAFPQGGARVLGTFETSVGTCRLILLESGLEQRAIACRDGTGWNLAFAASSAAGTGFTTASALAVEMTDQALDQLGAGAALGTAEEAEVLGF